MAAPTFVDLARVKAEARRFAAGFTPGQKAVTVLALLAALIGAVMFVQSASKTSYSPLFTGLSATDAGSITGKLQAAKVPYQLAAGGSTILVPTGQVFQERIDMAQAGLPAGGTVGLSILDKEGLTASQLTQQADYQRALQGELASTIQAIQGVATATVNLAIPAQSAFALSTPTPTGASVLVQMQPGASLSSGEVQAIVHLVASSVPGLDAQNVTVANGSGALLAGPGVDSSATQQNGQAAAYEAASTAKLQALLDSIVGPGNAQVAVNATLNFDKVSTTQQTVQTTPQGQPLLVPTTTSKTTESLTGTGVAAGGILGSTTPVTVPGGGSTNYRKTSTSNSYQTGQTTRTVQQAPGQLSRQSVAVAVNAAALPPGLNLRTLRQEVAAAAGIVPARGDQLAVSAMPFSNASAKAAAAARHKALMAQVRDGVLALVILAVLFLLWRSSRRSTTVPLALPMPYDDLPELEEAVPARQIPAMRSAVEPQLSQSVEGLIETQPEEMARLLRGWIAEGRSS